MARQRTFLFVLALALIIGLAPASPAIAASQPMQKSPAAQKTAQLQQTAQTGSSAHPITGVTISPAFQQISVDRNEASKDGQVKLTNNTGEPIEFSVSITDFGSLDESGGVLFVGKDQKSLDYRYGLSSWLTLQQDRIVVDAKETKAIPFTIDNKESMAPGGHYGAIMITPVQTDDNPTKVDVNQILTSLLFVKKEGGEVYRLGLQDVSVSHGLFTAPGSVSLRFQNSGNVHVIPRGVLTITDPRGYQVKQGIINEGSAIILPQAFRKLSAPLMTLGTAWMPGRYHLKIAYRYEGESEVQYYNSSFYYMNGWYVLAGVLILAIVAGLVFSKRLRGVLVRPFRALFG